MLTTYTLDIVAVLPCPLAKALMGAGLQSVIMHETGHILGLRCGSSSQLFTSFAFLRQKPSVLLFFKISFHIFSYLFGHRKRMCARRNLRDLDSQRHISCGSLWAGTILRAVLR